MLHETLWRDHVVIGNAATMTESCCSQEFLDLPFVLQLWDGADSLFRLWTQRVSPF
jgi:hypothetical protein